MNSGRKIAAKIGSLPSLRVPTRFQHISESPKQNWTAVSESFSFAVFDPNIKRNFEGETLYRAPISVTPSDSRMPKISDSSFLESDSSFLRAQYVTKE